MNEADTCRKFVVPLLQAAGWDDEPHSIAEQRSITDGRIVPVGRGFVRKPPKRVDYLLRATRDLPLALVEAKASWRQGGVGIQQALAKLEVPMPSLSEQLQFGSLPLEVRQLRGLSVKRQMKLDSLLPAILDRAFAGAL